MAVAPAEPALPPVPAIIPPAPPVADDVVGVPPAPAPPDPVAPPAPTVGSLPLHALNVHVNDTTAIIPWNWVELFAMAAPERD